MRAACGSADGNYTGLGGLTGAGRRDRQVHGGRATMEMNMFNLTGIGGLILLALDIWAIISIAGSSVSTGRKVLWILLVVVLPLIGFLIWLIAGPRSVTRVR